MAYLTIEDLVGTVEVIVFPRTFSTYRNIIEGTDKLFITGRVNANADENAKLICESVVSFEDVPRKLWIRFASEEEYLKKAADLAEELKYSDGKTALPFRTERFSFDSRMGLTEGFFKPSSAPFPFPPRACQYSRYRNRSFSGFSQGDSSVHPL